MRAEQPIRSQNLCHVIKIKWSPTNERPRKWNLRIYGSRDSDGRLEPDISRVSRQFGKYHFQSI